MKHCMECGARLRKKYLDGEGMVPYCDHCRQYRFPVFNTAVSMIVTNEDQSKIILIRQYGKPHYILVAGYVNKGEDAEDAAVREVKEEMGLDVVKARFNHSHYFAPSNTLMLNFTVTVAGTEPRPNREIDSWRWFDRDQALHEIKKGSLAGAFLKGYLTGSYSFAEADGLDPSELEGPAPGRTLNLAMAQMTMEEDQEKNRGKCFHMMKEAAERGADLVLFPELCLTRFFPQYRKADLAELWACGQDKEQAKEEGQLKGREQENEQGSGPVKDKLRQVTALTDLDSDLVQSFCRQCSDYGIMAVPNFYLEQDGKAYDVSLLIDRKGQILGCQKMVHIAGNRHFYETDYYDGSEEGFHVFDTEFGPMGIVLCYDRHFPESIRTEAEKGARLILVPAANCTEEPLELFEWEMRVQAYWSGSCLAMCNRTGPEGEMDFAGRSLVAGSDGSLLVKADREEGLIMTELDLSDSPGPRYRN